MRIPAEYIVQIQGKRFVKYAGLLQMAHERGLVELTAAWTYNDADLSLAHASQSLKTAIALKKVATARKRTLESRCLCTGVG